MVAMMLAGVSMMAMVLVVVPVMINDPSLHVRVFNMVHHHPPRWRWRRVIAHHLGAMPVMVR